MSKLKKTPTTTMTIRLPQDTKDALEALASRFGMSTSSLCSQILVLGLGIGESLEEEEAIKRAKREAEKGEKADGSIQ